MLANALVALVSLFFVALSVSAQELSVNTPSNLASCKPGTITWQGGRAPYFVSVVRASDPCGDAIFEFPETRNTWINFKDTTIAAGTEVIFSVEDANDVEVWTRRITIGEGDEDCLGAVNTASTPDGNTPASNSETDSTDGDDTDGEPNTPLNAGGGISAAPSQLRVQAPLAVAASALVGGVAALLL